MKNHIVLTLTCFTLLTTVCCSQGVSMAQTEKEDSAKVANMPKSVKENFAKMFPDAKNVKWSVYDAEYMAEFNLINPNAEHFIEHDGNMTVTFHRGGKNDSKWSMTSKKYTTPQSIETAVPAAALAKIKTEVKEQNDEDITSLEVVSCDDNCITSSTMKNGKLIEKNLTNNGYWVWGSKTQFKDGGMYTFTSDGTYAPEYQHDMMYNKKYKR